MMLVLLVLQTHRASRLWLRAFPRVLCNRISPYFDPRPAIHPNLPNPDEIQAENDAPAHERSAANILRAVFSALPGMEDAEFYLTRLAISFFVEVFVLRALLIVLELIARF
jgi:hypothetical protein